MDHIPSVAWITLRPSRTVGNRARSATDPFGLVTVAPPAPGLDLGPSLEAELAAIEGGSTAGFWLTPVAEAGAASTIGVAAVGFAAGYAIGAGIDLALMKYTHRYPETRSIDTSEYRTPLPLPWGPQTRPPRTAEEWDNFRKNNPDWREKARDWWGIRTRVTLGSMFRAAPQTPRSTPNSKSS